MASPMPIPALVQWLGIQGCHRGMQTCLCALVGIRLWMCTLRGGSAISQSEVENMQPSWRSLLLCVGELTGVRRAFGFLWASLPLPVSRACCVSGELLSGAPQPHTDKRWGQWWWRGQPGGYILWCTLVVTMSVVLRAGRWPLGCPFNIL